MEESTMRNQFSFTLNKDGWKVYNIPDNLCKEMLGKADKALVNCFPKHGGKGFAITVLTKEGNMYEGAVSLARQRR